ncbi:hypothetical protein GCM10009764_57640 [Nocardia ninae]|uniref:Uncharacterized protein n=1 Tax=Nocardia ninae NBRC 108245 TaxID=1210091 RepID=A0A511M4M1_9NOCA|nr:hypothetical protein NN4_01020 [Nocardia ninae NBRC 108245]
MRVRDFCGGAAFGPFHLFGGFLANPIDFLGSLAARGAHFGLRFTTRGEYVIGGLPGGALDFAQRIITGAVGVGNQGFGTFGRSGRVIGGGLGERTRLLRFASRLFRGDSGHFGLGDTPGGIGLHRLDLRFGDGRVAQGGQLGNSGIQGVTQLVCQATKLNEQLICAEPGRSHRTLLRHSDRTGRCLRLLL